MSTWNAKCRPAWTITAMVLGIVGGLAAEPASHAQTKEPEKLYYNFHIRPLLADRCFICHGPDERARKAELRLDAPEIARANGILVPGKPERARSSSALPRRAASACRRPRRT